MNSDLNIGRGGVSSIPSKTLRQWHMDQKPFLLITIGAPGSGKSAIQSHLPPNTMILSTDRMRQERVIKAGGNPLDPSQVFNTEMRLWAHDQIRKEFDLALQKKRSLFLDMTSVNSFRVPFLIAAKTAGYMTFAVVLHSPNPEVNSLNITQRVSDGGLDLVAAGPAGEAKRLSIIRSLEAEKNLFIDSLIEAPMTTVPDFEYWDFPFAKLKDCQTQMDLSKALSDAELTWLNRIRQYDRVDKRVDWFTQNHADRPARDWSERL